MTRRTTNLMDRLTSRINSTHDERKEGGFTLIELLIVIVILGVLAGIAIFALDGFKEDAESACTSANDRITATVDAANTAKGGGTDASADNMGDCDADS